MLESATLKDSEAVKVIFAREGETREEAKKREGVVDWPGQIIFVQFVEP